MGDLDSVSSHSTPNRTEAGSPYGLPPEKPDLLGGHIVKAVRPQSQLFPLPLPLPAAHSNNNPVHMFEPWTDAGTKNEPSEKEEFPEGPEDIDTETPAPVDISRTEDSNGPSKHEKMKATGERVDSCAKLAKFKVGLGVMVQHYGFAPAADLKPAPNLGGASIGMIRTLASGIKYFVATRNLKKSESELSALTQEMDKPDLEPDKRIVLGIKKENLSTVVATHKKIIETLKKEKVIAVLSASGFSSNVAALVTTAKIGAIATSTVSGVVCGAILTGTSIQAMVQEAELQKKLTQEAELLPRRFKGVAGIVITLRKDNIQNTQIKDISKSHIKNALFGTLGTVAMTGGILAILAKVGVAIAAVVVVGSGYGLIAAAVIAIGALATIGILKYRSMSQGKMGTIIEKQQNVMELQKQLNSLIQESPLNKELVIKINNKLKSEKMELNVLIVQHKMEFQASKEHQKTVATLFEQIDQFKDPDHQEDILQIQKATGLDLRFIAYDPETQKIDESSKEQLKNLLVGWVTNPKPNSF